jgi:hypothetical protein
VAEGGDFGKVLAQALTNHQSTSVPWPHICQYFQLFLVPTKRIFFSPILTTEQTTTSTIRKDGFHVCLTPSPFLDSLNGIAACHLTRFCRRGPLTGCFSRLRTRTGHRSSSIPPAILPLSFRLGNDPACRLRDGSRGVGAEGSTFSLKFSAAWSWLSARSRVLTTGDPRSPMRAKALGGSVCGVARWERSLGPKAVRNGALPEELPIDQRATVESAMRECRPGSSSPPALYHILRYVGLRTNQNAQDRPHPERHSRP